MTFSKKSRSRAYRRGWRAEVEALWWLRLKGYRILFHRFRTPHGEIDLIVQKRTTLIMVEVKARPTLEKGLTCITSKQQQRWVQAVQFFHCRFPDYPYTSIRLDVIVKQPWRWPVHFPHVFIMDRIL